MGVRTSFKKDQKTYRTSGPGQTFCNYKLNLENKFIFLNILKSIKMIKYDVSRTQYSKEILAFNGFYQFL